MRRPSASTPAASAFKLRRDPARLASSWTAYRQTDTDPNRQVFWRVQAASRPIAQDAGRWNLPGGEYAQYLSLTEEGAWAEWIRARELRTAQAAVQTLRRMWITRVHETDIADFSTQAKAGECGIEPTVLVGPHEPCQAIAGELQAAGFRGVLSPCAALDRTLNLTLWGPRIDDHLLPTERFSASTRDPEVIEVKILRAASSPPGYLIDETRPLRSDPRTYQWGP